MKTNYGLERTRRKPQPKAPGAPERRPGPAGYLVLAALLVLVGAVAWAGWEGRSAKAYNTHNLIRLHVVAGSDSPADQALKLEVKDAVVRAAGDLFTARVSGNHFTVWAPGEVTAEIMAGMESFREIAEDVVRAAGSSLSVTAEFGVFAFPEREYGGVVLPEGDYQALRIVLGEGRGANWWCVLFPPLCYLDVVGGRAMPQASGDLRELETLLREASAAGIFVGADGELRPLSADIAAGSESEHFVVVADTGADELEVRFFLFERFKELVRFLTRTLPWLAGGEAER